MELSIEKLRSPRRRSSFSSSFFPEDQASSACSTPFVSAPSSPRYYYSAPPSPPPLRHDLGGAEAAVPFSWEERPGTPKSSSPTSSSRTTMKNSVDHLAAMGMGFHFSAPVSPQRGEFDHQVNGGLIDEFEFSSARISDADSVVSHADELFFQGQILPLTLPSRLQHHKSISLQLQDFSPRTSDVFSPGAALSSHQLPSPKPLLKSPPRLSSPLQSPHRSRSPSKLAKVGFPDENSFRSRSRHPPPSSPRRSLRELLHLSVSTKFAILKPSDSRSGSKSSSGTDSRSGSLKSSGTDSRSSSNSSSSQRFSNSRSSSVSSSGASRQVTPVSSRELLQNYSKNHKPQELRRKTLLPYSQGLLGCLSCLTVPSLRRVQDLDY
ncbi:hypothetical protein SELMODRAFT_444332 [Selaginella moellendorffii]|uniref:Uncharacterized protein n=1 Tax=Selaginella moellendorffii TaxID=88036 RepID=D8S920_SELML|nr:probable membrane-associated kinase regulator 3 [Selaginella moellendorffii]EFJ19126.1 hypothetical protein SELMODRAFT_444332 [Selaginella moellendorffii]|eukprot:XP_002979724.1 probable membrane-associated kinase regulator 3 [Selaginella moellendorffii]